MLRFVFGPSGAGKSRQICEEIIERAGKYPKQNFFMIVPDQFTMQTQKDLVLLNPRGGIMNIDVLSFGRLSHRIMEEVGGEEYPVLDDTGKSLILQKLAAEMREELPTLGAFLNKQGYIHEVKSAISEFMQYGIAPQDVDTLIAYAEKRGALVQKLQDLQKLYEGFAAFINGRFVTTEGKMGILTRSLGKSRILPGSVVIFDGFTGFTPIQYQVIQGLLPICEEVVVTVTLGQGEDPFKKDGEQKLFALSKKTVADLEKLAKAVQVGRGQDVYLTGPVKRFEQAPDIAYLEQNLFRNKGQGYEQTPDDIVMFETTTPQDEVRQAGLMLKRLIMQQGYAYRDIAVIVGDMSGYGPYVETEFEKLQIPVYIDKTRQLVLNPMVEFIKSVLELHLKDFSYDAVFHYLRSGLADVTPEEVDLLDNYVTRTGLRGYHGYSRLFTKKGDRDPISEEELACLNTLREKLMAQTEIFHARGSAPAAEYVEKMYDFLVQNKVQEKLALWESRFTLEGNATRAKEYAQVYRLILEILEQIHGLLGEEEITLQEFSDILEAGFAEIEVGTIPQNVDRVIVGDMERTRLKQVKVLFFLGVNDGNIPKNASKGGIISDMDREFLRESELELAPSPRQQMFIQRLYLYMNMTKPSERLYIGYSKINNAGKSMRPAYLIETIQKMFPKLQTIYPEQDAMLDQVVTVREGAGYLASGLREYVSGNLPEEKLSEVLTLYRAYEEYMEPDERDLLCRAAFQSYKKSGLSKIVANALYGHFLENSVSRLETFASCAYAHFLKYGLGLKEKDEFSLERNDFGNIYHGVLEAFAGKLAENHMTWFDFTEEYATETVHHSLEEYAATYGSQILYHNARNEYALSRMERILTRTVLTLQKHLQKGTFLPDSYEMSFRFTDSLASVNLALSEQEKLHLNGRIDRVDVAEDAEHVYVKIIDYKSGNKEFDMAALYYGLQLQLVVYMNAAMEIEQNKYPDKEIVPAAMLYYHIQDPAVESAGEISAEEIVQKIEEQLCMKGMVNEAPEILEKLDNDIDDKSCVIPVVRNKEGALTAKDNGLSTDDFKTVSKFTTQKMIEIGREIMSGGKEINPCVMGDLESCKYCSFKRVCGYDPAIPGYETRTLEEIKKTDVINRMQEELWQ